MSDLIARLYNDCVDFDDPICGEAADALEAKDKRIAELETDGALLRAANFGQSQTIDGYSARIAALEAALKPFADYSQAVDWEVFTPEMHFARSLKFPCDITYGDLRAARAVLEKKDD